MEPTLIANNSTYHLQRNQGQSYAELSSKHGRFWNFWRNMAKYCFRLNVYDSYIEKLRSMKFYVNVPRGMPNLTACILLTFIHSFLSYDI
jgi:hypothetical protein